MRRIFLFGLGALIALAGWTVLIGAGTLENWWRKPLAPRGDAAGFFAAATKMIDRESHGAAAFALVHEGRTYSEHFRSIGAPVDRDTVFQVASMSKWITALGVMTLVDSGRIDLDAPVETYLKRWRLPPSEFDNRQVTVRRLLSHTAGLTDGLGYGGFKPGEPIQPLVESLTKAKDASPGHDGVVRVGIKPGEEWRYSGGGYAVLQLLIEDVTGEPFAAYMHRAVLEPLGMANSTFITPGPEGPRVAGFYDTEGRPAIHYRFSAVSAASLYTSVADMTRLIQAHRPGLDHAPIGRGVLSPEILAAMRRPHGFKYGAEIWGLGVMLYAPTRSGEHIVGHDGSNDPAINTAARFDPTSGDGIVVLETGDRLLATHLASEWVYWRTGQADALAVFEAVPRTLPILIGGWAVIVIVAAGLGWRFRRPRLQS